MVKLIVLVIIVYVIYRAVNKKRIIVRAGKTPDIRNVSGQLVDEMVQDPFCKTFFPRQQGVALDHNNEKLLFCSKACLDKFRSEIGTKSNDSTNRRS